MASISSSTAITSSQVAETVTRMVTEVSQVLLGKDEQVKLALTCLFAQGHLLLEDLPGMGKTTLAHALAKVMGLEYQRVQFTSDLLPSDIVGVSVFDRDSSCFHFHAGPVFTQLLLADEINRTTPKTQSALLEAMAERQVTVEGETRLLPTPFFVIATQNPITQSGTFALPESQLDRFLMRIELGYPQPEAELQILKGINPEARMGALQAQITLDQLAAIQQAVERVQTSDSLLAYVQRLVAFSRTQAEFAYGLSTRGALALLRSAKAWALIQGRNHVLPEDIQTLLPAVAAHRLTGAGDFADGAHTSHSGYALVDKLLHQVDVLG